MASMSEPLTTELGASGEELLRALLANVADAIYAVDQDGRVRYANPTALMLLGYEANEILGRLSHATIHHHRPDGTPFDERDCPLLRPRTTGETIRVDLDWFIRRDGSFVAVSYSSAPLRVHGRSGAVVVFRDVSERELADAERRRAEAIRSSRARIVEGALAERKRLARDLHDGAQQRLVNLAVSLQATASMADQESVKRALGGALDEARATLADLRDLAAGLHPTILTNRGLAAAIGALTARSPIPITLEIPRDRYPDVIEATAYFVIAEALANVVKHAQATQATVSLVRADDVLTVTIRDDGIGGADESSGSGLRGLHDRVAAVDGVLEIGAGADGGTCLTARLPAELAPT
jgi:PAS domain S-box-containing protein